MGENDEERMGENIQSGSRNHDNRPNYTKYMIAQSHRKGSFGSKMFRYYARRARIWLRYFWYLHLDPIGRRDRKRLEDTMPESRRFTRGSCTVGQELKSVYDDYITRVSSATMAISFELACFLWQLCETMKPQRILDLGSGFSSFVFRYYQFVTATRLDVWSVDHSPFWLDRTRMFLDSHGLPSDNLYTWDEIRPSNSGRFDLVLHDLGPSHTRARILDEVLALRRPEGLLILDDVHMPRYLAELDQKLARYDSLERYTPRALTIDKYLRYSMVIGQKAPLAEENRGLSYAQE